MRPEVWVSPGPERVRVPKNLAVSCGSAWTRRPCSRSWGTRQDWMSRQELERLVGEAEASAGLREQLQRCRSRDQVVLVARRLGYRLTGKDLLRAWWEDRAERRALRDGVHESPGTLRGHHL